VQAGVPRPRRCLVCDRAEPFSTVYSRGEFRLVRCEECWLVFQHPVPAPEAMARLYYHSEEFTAQLEGPLRAVLLARAGEKLARLEAAGVEPRGQALDVGCSTGAWLEVAAEAGWEPAGVELGARSAEAARARGFEVHVGDFADARAELEGRRFDLITFWDVLEHLADPLDALRGAARMLSDGGVLALTLPNVDGMYPRLTYRLIARRTGVWEYPELPAHLFDFSPTTLGRLGTLAGLERAAISTTATPFDYYRTTALPGQLAARRWRGRPLRLAFEGLRVIAYPIARMFDRGNSMFATFTRVQSRP